VQVVKEACASLVQLRLDWERKEPQPGTSPGLPGSSSGCTDGCFWPGAGRAQCWCSGPRLPAQAFCRAWGELACYILPPHWQDGKMSLSKDENVFLQMC